MAAPDTLQPTDRIRRSNLYRVCSALGAHWIDINGFACPARYGETPGEAAGIGIADLTALPRAGYKGWDMAGWMAGQGLELPEPNMARPAEDGTLACRLSAGELLLLAPDSAEAGTIERLAEAWSIEGATCYPVPRSDASARIAVTGADAPDMMAKICGIDLRAHRFENHRIAQTSVARMNAILVRNDRGTTYALDMIIDSASIVYMWTCLTDAMAEYGGRAIGLLALEAMAGERDSSPSSLSPTA